MNKKVSFHAALIMMCVFAFSVSLGSCDKKDADHSDDEYSLSLNVDTNGVNVTIKPLLDWGATLADVETFMAKNYPTWEVEDEGKLLYDSIWGDWMIFYGCNRMTACFYFDDETGNNLIMTEYFWDGSNDIKRIQDELVRFGFIYKGLLYWDYLPDDLTYLYFSADEKLEVQVGVNNDDSDDYWVINFQPTDKNDLNQLIDQTTLSLIINSENDSCILTPMRKWGASLTDVKEFMAQNYPDWEIQNNGELICDTISEDSLEWYAKFQNGEFSQFFIFDNADGESYNSFQFVDYTSTDEISLDRELTRNGLVYVGHDTTYYAEEISSHVYVPLSKDYIAVASAWEMYGGCRVIDVSPYDEEYIKGVKRE